MPLLTDRAYERIRHDIISCAIAPGAEISEAQLCAQYKLGKAPVRMALNRLAHDGLVRAIPRRGYMVAPVTVRDIHDVFELRLMLEPAAARMAAGKVDAAAAAGARRSLPRRLPARGREEHVAVSRSEQGFPRGDRAGHGKRAARRRDRAPARRDDAAPAPGPRPAQPVPGMQQEHRALVKALARGDGDTAERICREQIEAARNMVLSAILTSSSVMNLALAAEHPR